MDDRLYFRQLLSGQDYAEQNVFAQQMVNHTYCIGDARTKEAVLVDPTYDIKKITATLERDEMKLVGVILTHYHADHAGGSIAGNSIEGVADLLDSHDVAVHVQRAESEFLQRSANLSPSAMSFHESGDTVKVGEISIELIGTPGHTPGSQCLLLDGRLLTGDTLFLEGCGRTDLPGGDATELYYSLTQRLRPISDQAIVFPGHHYSEQKSQPLGSVRSANPVFQPLTAENWVASFATK